jgi:thiol:disulfide interchange protein DsbD
LANPLHSKSIGGQEDSTDRAKGPHIWVRLVCEQTFFNIKQTSIIGVFFMMEKGWHVYWKNPGDSGQAPSVKWVLPKGFKAGDLMWPLPERIHIPSLTDFGYRDQVVLMAPLEVPAGLKIGSAVTLKAEVNWLVCKDICVPGHAVLNLRVPVQKGVPKVPFKDVTLFSWGHASQADPLPGDWTSKGNATKDGFELGFTTGSQKISKADFFPLDPDVLDNETDPVFRGGWGPSFGLKLKKSDQLLKTPASLRGLLVVVNDKGRKAGYWADLPLK